MFTGLVMEVGRIRKATPGGGLALVVEGPATVKDLSEGDSVAVNGVCLTATRIRRKAFEAHAVPETLARTTLGHLQRGARVNLECAARVGGRLGGHVVQGHVDGIVEVVELAPEGEGMRMGLGVPENLHRYVVEKGSVTLDGVSLTASTLTPTGFEVALIPHTLERTTLGEATVGSLLNLEVDVLARYVERLLGRSGPKG